MQSHSSVGFLFALVFTAGLFGLLTFGYGTALAAAWGGREDWSDFLIRLWIGPVLLILGSLVASIGIYNQKKIGLITGYAVSISALFFIISCHVLFLGDIVNRLYSVADLLGVIWTFFLWSGIPLLLLIGVYIVHKKGILLRKRDYWVLAGLTSLLSIFLLGILQVFSN